MVKQPTPTPRRPHDQASVAIAVDGQVLVDGPNGLAIAFTPEAALRSAEAISAAAHRAERQNKKAAE